MTHFAFSYQRPTLIALNSTDCRGTFAWVYIAPNRREWDVFDWARLSFMPLAGMKMWAHTPGKGFFMWSA